MLYMISVYWFVILFCKLFSTLQKLSKLKTILWDVIDYLVIHTGFSESTEEFQQVSNYRDKLLEMLVKLLDEEGTKIDYDETGKLRS